MRLAVLLAVICLSGCAALPRVPPPAGPDARSAELAALEAWRAHGRVAVAVDGDGVTANLDWRQSGASSDISLSGPFGVGALLVELDAGGLTLDDGRGGRLAGADAEALLEQRLGTRVPLAALRYWMLGIPAPGAPWVPVGAAAFEQSGWRVTVTRFTSSDAGPLPARLDLEQGAARLRLAVSRWEVGR